MAISDVRKSETASCNYRLQLQQRQRSGEGKIRDDDGLTARSYTWIGGWAESDCRWCRRREHESGRKEYGRESQQWGTRSGEMILSGIHPCKSDTRAVSDAMQQETGEKKEWGLGKDVLYLGAATAKPRRRRSGDTGGRPCRQRCGRGTQRWWPVKK
jgi:hypothetical protein